MDDIEDLKNHAREIRKRIFLMCERAGGGHIAPSFSVVEILTALYFRVLRRDPDDPETPDRDRLILSKGHACAALYASLAEAGIIDESLLDAFCLPGGRLGGHPDRHPELGIEATTGALGHGLPFGVGIAWAGRMDRAPYRVFVVLGDGECQEGSVWEAAFIAAHHGLDNLAAVIDYNKLQALDEIQAILALEPLADKWRAAGWCVREADGHDLAALVDGLGSVPFEPGKPSCLIAHTVKGKGISFMENKPIWHYRLPVGEEMERARKELGI